MLIYIFNKKIVENPFMMSRQKADNMLYVFAVGLCIITLLLLPFQQNFALKWLRVAGEVSLIAILISPKKYLYSNTKYISISLLILATVSFLWFRLYKVPDSEYVGAYMNYRDWSLVGIFSSFIIPVVTSERENSKKIIKNILLVVALVVNIICIAYACYQFFILGEQRATLSLAYGPNATGAAYMITFVSLYALIAISITIKNYKFEMLALFGFANFISICATGTRAGIIIYPIIIAFILWNEIKGYDRKKKIMRIYTVVALAIASGLLLSKPLTQRVDALKSDIAQYNSENTETSVGARFAMYETGIKSSYNNYLGQSLEERNEKIIAIVDKNHELTGALKYLNTHLHNQLIDTLSTTGWLGVILNILFLVSIIMFSYKNKFPLMYTYVAALILYSSSDMLAYAIPVPLSWLLTLILICSLINNRDNA